MSVPSGPVYPASTRASTRQCFASEQVMHDRLIQELLQSTTKITKDTVVSMQSTRQTQQPRGSLNPHHYPYQHHSPLLRQHQ